MASSTRTRRRIPATHLERQVGPSTSSAHSRRLRQSTRWCRPWKSCSARRAPASGRTRGPLPAPRPIPDSRCWPTIRTSRRRCPVCGTSRRCDAQTSTTNATTTSPGGRWPDSPGCSSATTLPSHGGSPTLARTSPISSCINSTATPISTTASCGRWTFAPKSSRSREVIR